MQFDPPCPRSLFFFFNDPAPPEIYPLPYTTLFRSRHVPADPHQCPRHRAERTAAAPSEGDEAAVDRPVGASRSEEHTSELQSQSNLVCRLLLEKKKKKATEDDGSAELSCAFVEVLE